MPLCIAGVENRSEATATSTQVVNPRTTTMEITEEKHSEKIIKKLKCYIRTYSFNIKESNKVGLMEQKRHQKNRKQKK